MTIPKWLQSVVRVEELAAIESPFLIAEGMHSADQGQTEQTFSFKWSQNETFKRRQFRDNSGNWYISKYGPVTDDIWWQTRSCKPTVVEIGPGAGVSAEYLLRGRLADINYLGIDISTAIYEADRCLRSLGGDPWFLRADALKAPINQSCADLVFSEGVLHHTDDTKRAVQTAAGFVAPGGRLAFYVYKKKAPTREFTDDFIRSRIADLSPELAWEKLLPLSKLGLALGELNQNITVPEDVELLGIPAGTYDVQRFVYWFVCKMYYRPEFTIEEMNHINFDWFTPKNCFRHTPEEVTGWISELGLDLTWMRVEDAGITVVADRPA